MGPVSLRAGSRSVALIGVTSSPLTISDSDGEVIRTGSRAEKLHLFHHLYGHENLIINNA